MADILDWVSLSLVPGLGVTGLGRLVDFFAGPDWVLRATAKERSQVGGIRAEALQGLSDAGAVRKRGEQELERLTGLGALAICLEDLNYPSLLRQICTPPPVLYIRGRKELLESCCVAIVGSRAATSYGHRIASALAHDLAGRGVAVWCPAWRWGLMPVPMPGRCPYPAPPLPCWAAGWMLSIRGRIVVYMNRFRSVDSW